MLYPKLYSIYPRGTIHPRGFFTVSEEATPPVLPGAV